MRCREQHNPFTKLGQYLFAFHGSEAIIARKWGQPDLRRLNPGKVYADQAVPIYRYNFFVARVLMVSSEAAPLAKTGGLADVVGSLPYYLRSDGDEAAVVIPRYGSIELKGIKRVYDSIPVFLGPDRYDTTIYQAPAEFPFYLVDCPPLFAQARKGFYGESGVDYPDNHIRFAVFARAALGIVHYLFRPDVIHCHDWQSGLVPVYMKTTFATDPTFAGVKTLFTIHNLGYQGLFPKAAAAEVALDPGVFRPDAMEFFGRIAY